MELGSIAGIRLTPIAVARPDGTGLAVPIEIDATAPTGEDTYSPSDGQGKGADHSEESSEEVESAPEGEDGTISVFV